MHQFYDPNIDREKLIKLLNDCQLKMDDHLSKAVYYKYLAQETRSLLLLQGYEELKEEEIQTINIERKIPKLKVWDNSMHPALRKLKGKKLQKALDLFDKYEIEK